MLEAGLEFNLGSRLSLRGDFTYFRESTDPKLFRELVHEMTRLIAFEALRNLPTVPVSVRTPMGDAAGVKIAGHLVVAPILRAGMGMLDPMLELLPYATAGVIGTKRNEETAGRREQIVRVGGPGRHGERDDLLPGSVLRTAAGVNTVLFRLENGPGPTGFSVCLSPADEPPPL